MANEVDRRRFLKYTGVAGAATGALWVAPSVLGSSSAFATGTNALCDNPQTLNWTSLAGSMPAPNQNGPASTTVTVPANGFNPAIDVRITTTPILTPGPGSYQSSSGTGGVNFEGTPFNGSNSYYLLFMENSQPNEGYDVKFEFFDTGTTTPRPVFNLSLSLGGLTNAHSGANDGYDDTVWVDQTFITSHGSDVTGSGTVSNPWVGQTNQNNNAWVNLDLNAASSIDNFMVSYTNGPNYWGVSQWVWINDLSWC